MTTETAAAETIPSAGMDLFAAMYTTRAMRRLKPDPIPAEVLRTIMDAAIRAPSGGNAQGWNFLVVQDEELRRGLGAIYKPCLDTLFAPDSHYTRQAASPDPELARGVRRMIESAQYLGDHLHEAPVIVVPCLRTGGRPLDFAGGSSIYPAVQNLMLAARALGIGSTLTTVHRMRQDEVRALLGIPADVETAALIPLGYPTGRWGVAKRRPVEVVVYGDRWQEPLFR
jgi:nitroreductase